MAADLNADVTEHVPPLGVMTGFDLLYPRYRLNCEGSLLLNVLLHVFFGAGT